MKHIQSYNTVLERKTSKLICKRNYSVGGKTLFTTGDSYSVHSVNDKEGVTMQDNDDELRVINHHILDKHFIHPEETVLERKKQGRPIDTNKSMAIYNHGYGLQHKIDIENIVFEDENVCLCIAEDKTYVLFQPNDGKILTQIYKNWRVINIDPIVTI